MSITQLQDNFTTHTKYSDNSSIISKLHDNYTLHAKLQDNGAMTLASVWQCTAGRGKITSCFCRNIMLLLCCSHTHTHTHTHKQQSKNEQNKRVAFAKNTAAVTLKFIWHIIFLHPHKHKNFSKTSWQIFYIIL